MIKVCVITGGRMDYGHLHKVMKAIDSSSILELQIIATCMHLSPEFGLTFKRIEDDGFKINKKVECLLSSDTSSAVAKSIGLACISFSDAFKDLNPDLILLMGDRYEILSASQVALIMKIPIAHISGGDTTEGAYDEAIRHSITKMSHLHFVTNIDAYKRVKQLGENPKYIFNVGSPTIDYIIDTPMISKEELEKKLEFKMRNVNIIFTYHPVTLNKKQNRDDLIIILDALSDLGDDVGILITKSNADDEGRVLNQEIENFVAKHKNTKSYDSLGQFLYYNCINCFDCVVGNSSSGLFEVPTFKKPSVNIGDRQKGRMKSESVIDCGINKKEIKKAIIKAFNMNCDKVVNPYGQGKSAEKIVSILENIDIKNISLQKHFYS
tara:strand:+ start:10065 stop:11207 length:1143 start_codon:yes stop_codon:yes gene_type:complete